MSKLELFVLAIIILWIILPCHLAVPETGQHTGYITESGVRGLIWKTHYIKVVDSQVAYSGTSTWYYGITENDYVATLDFNKAQEAQTTKSLVTISYTCYLFTWSWESSESCRITDITTIK